jgi:hypothetical protein
MTIRILRGETFIGVLVRRNYEIGMSRIQILPERAEGGPNRMLGKDTAAEECMVAVGKFARIRMCLEVRA